MDLVPMVCPICARFDNYARGSMALKLIQEDRKTSICEERNRRGLQEKPNLSFHSLDVSHPPAASRETCSKQRKELWLESRELI
jgi:hypothetical protein